MVCPSVIALDGPAGAGKTTVGSLLTRQLSYLFFDTGVMWRAATLASLWNGILIEDEVAVTALSRDIVIDVQLPKVNDGRLYTVLLNGKDVTHEIRNSAVNANVYTVSTYPGVQAALIVQQERIGARGQVVMAGWGIGTVVPLQADIFFFLDATPEERARRRLQDCLARGEKSAFLEILAILRAREQVSLRPVADAMVIDSTNLTVAEVVTKIDAVLKSLGCIFD